MPSAEFVYADRDGHIGRQLAARCPAALRLGSALPVPGAELRYEWNGWAPVDRPSTEIDPATAYASCRPTAAGRVRAISSNGSRTRRREASRLQTASACVVAWNAQRLVPLLAASRRAGQGRQAPARSLRWDRRITPDSPEAEARSRWETALRRSLAARHQLTSWTTMWIGPARCSCRRLSPRRASGSTDRRHASATCCCWRRSPRRKDSSRDGVSQRTVTFAHPLAVNGPASNNDSTSARSRCRLRRNRPFDDRPRSGRSIACVARSFSTPATGIDRGDQRPGQSGSADSPHFKDLATSRAAGEYFPLTFSEARRPRQRPVDTDPCPLENSGRR